MGHMTQQQVAAFILAQCCLELSTRIELAAVFLLLVKMFVWKLLSFLLKQKEGSYNLYLEAQLFVLKNLHFD